MKRNNETKTIDINCLEWFDKVNGNSYFAGTVTVNLGMPNEFRFYLPFQYGYDSQYLHEAATQLHKRGYLTGYADYGSFTRYCREYGIILRYQLIDRCKKAELKAIDKLIEAQ